MCCQGLKTFWGFVDYAQTLLDFKRESRLIEVRRGTGEYLVNPWLKSGPALESEPASQQGQASQGCVQLKLRYLQGWRAQSIL